MPSTSPYGPQTDNDGCCVTCELKLWYVNQRGDLRWRDCGCWLFSDDPRYDPLNGVGMVAQSQARAD